MKMRQKMVVLLTIALVLVLAACSTNKSTADNPSAKKGSITLYTSQPEEDIQKMITAFNKTYPEITVNYFRSGTEEIISKVMAEKETGTILADVLLVSDDATFESLKSADLLMSYKSSELNGIDESFYDAGNTYTGTKLITTGIIQNTDIIKEDIVSYKQLLDSRYDNELNMPSPLYSGAAAYNLGILTRTSGIGWDFYEGLKKNHVVVGKGNGGVSQAVVGGQQGLGIVVDYLAIRAANSGSPVKFIYPSEGSLVVTEPIGILKSSKNADQAKSFVDYILSDEGQKETAKIGYTPIKEGIDAPEGFKSVKDIKVLSTDLKSLVEGREADKTKFSDLFN